MDKEKIKYNGFIKRAWSDPVLSQLLAAGILALLTLLYSFGQTLFQEISFWTALKQTFTYQLELYKVFILLTIVIVIYILSYKWRQRQKKRVGKFDVERNVGDFNFRELYNALLTHKVKLPNSLHSHEFGNQSDLLTLFMLYQRQLNTGVNWNHGGDQGTFLYYVLAPTLMTYGLVKRTSDRSKRDTLKLDIFETSQTGFKFYALLERWRVYNDELMKDDITKTENAAPNQDHVH